MSRSSLEKNKHRENVAAQIEPPQRTVYCYHCGQAYGKEKGIFPVSRAPLYQAHGYLPFCRDCVERMYEEYARRFNSDREAVRRMCAKLDLYWNDNIYDAVERSMAHGTRMQGYISKVNTAKYIGKSYDNTLDEERRQLQDAGFIVNGVFVVPDKRELVDPFEIPVDPDDQAFWGLGYTADAYQELNMRYAQWTEPLGELDPAERSMYKQACILEMTIARDSAAGKPVDKHVNALNTLLGSLNLKPAQKKSDVSEEFENMPLGVGIGKLETLRPISKPAPEFEDVDGIVKYVTVWFLGHLCHMLGIRNTYCKLYEQEMERLRVSAPEFQDDSDDETLFDDIFGGGDPN